MEEIKPGDRVYTTHFIRLSLGDKLISLPKNSRGTVLKSNIQGFKGDLAEIKFDDGLVGMLFVAEFHKGEPHA